MTHTITVHGAEMPCGVDHGGWAWYGEQVACLVNLTPHDIHLSGDLLPRSGTVARVTVTERPVTTTVGYTTVETTLGAVTDLPSEAEGVAYVVSRMVCEAAPTRRDLYAPYGLTRDDSGRITGCESLCQVAAPRRRRWQR